jgi:hypothetical protein
MQVNQLTIKSYPGQGQMNVASMPGRMSESGSGTVKGFLNRLIGCWHMEMSRPFSSDGKAYRVCLRCGAHRQFNLKNWKMQGDFYFSGPTSKHFRTIDRLAAVRTGAQSNCVTA